MPSGYLTFVIPHALAEASPWMSAPPRILSYLISFRRLLNSLVARGRLLDPPSNTPNPPDLEFGIPPERDRPSQDLYLHATRENPKFGVGTTLRPPINVLFDLPKEISKPPFRLSLSSF